MLPYHYRHCVGTNRWNSLVTTSSTTHLHTGTTKRPSYTVNMSKMQWNKNILFFLFIASIFLFSICLILTLINTTNEAPRAAKVFKMEASSFSSFPYSHPLRHSPLNKFLSSTQSTRWGSTTNGQDCLSWRFLLVILFPSSFSSFNHSLPHLPLHSLLHNCTRRQNSEGSTTEGQDLDSGDFYFLFF